MQVVIAFLCCPQAETKVTGNTMRPMEQETRVQQPQERPRALAVNFATIPQELQHNPSWVVWQYHYRDGHWTKLPLISKSGSLASVANPHTWGSFEQAKAAYETGRYAGVGLVLTKALGIVGVDIDHCIHNGIITPKAKEMIETLHTYTEISPSGQGIRCFLQGKLPGGYHRAGHIELYEDRRYLTLTGYRLPHLSQLAERQTELERVYANLFPVATTLSHAIESARGGENEINQAKYQLPDETILKHASSARNGELFARYYAGDPSLWEGEEAMCASHSEADFTLCLMLLFWTNGDIAQTDRLFRQSGLMRAKWDRRLKDNLTYGQFTLMNAAQKGRRLGSNEHS